MATVDLGTLMGERIREGRKARGNWSQQDLLDHLAAAGLNMSRQTLYRLEKGDPEAGGRPLTVQELLTLAFVLGVPPADLVTPMEHTEDFVQVTPKVTMPIHAAYQWFVGLDRPVVKSRRWPSSMLDYSPDEYERATAPYQEWLRLRVNQRACGKAHSRLQTARHTAASDEVSNDAESSFVHAARTFEASMRAVRSHGLTPPALGESYALDVARACNRGADFDVWLEELGLRTFDPEGDR